MIKKKYRIVDLMGEGEVYGEGLFITEVTRPDVASRILREHRERCLRSGRFGSMYYASCFVAYEDTYLFGKRIGSEIWKEKARWAR